MGEPSGPRPRVTPTPEARALFRLPLFDSLSDEQRRAVFADAPRLVVLAGAGSGKTRVLVARVARLLWGPEPVDARRLLAVSFTRKACGEIRERLADVRAALGLGDAPLPTVDTFHATALKIVRDGLRPVPRVLDEGPEAQSFFRRFMEQDAWLRGRAIPRERLEEALAQGGAGVLTRAQADAVRTRYRIFKLAHGVMGLDDLVPLALGCLEDPALRRRWQGRFDVLLIDEFQDVDDAQHRLTEVLTGGGASFCLFGDDDQAIYGWRGSNPECLRSMARREDVLTVVLPTNYRSVPPVLELASEMIRGDVQRIDKPVVAAREGGPRPRLVIAEDEGAALTAEVGHLLHAGQVPGDICVLVREHSDGRRVLRMLEQAGIAAVPAAEGDHGDALAVKVQTYHGAKGLEYPVVVMPFLSAGHFPNTRRERRELASLRAELVEARTAASALERARAARRRALTRLWWVLQSAHLPRARWSVPPGRLGRILRRVVIAGEAVWRALWREDIHRSLVLRQREVERHQAPIARLKVPALRLPALTEAVEGAAAASRARGFEERRLAYVAITRARDQWIGLCRSEAEISPFLKDVAAHRLERAAPRSPSGRRRARGR